VSFFSFLQVCSQLLFLEGAASRHPEKAGGNTHNLSYTTRQLGVERAPPRRPWPSPFRGSWGALDKQGQGTCIRPRGMDPPSTPVDESLKSVLISCLPPRLTPDFISYRPHFPVAQTPSHETDGALRLIMSLAHRIYGTARGARAVRWRQSLWIRRWVTAAKSSGEEADKGTRQSIAPPMPTMCDASLSTIHVSVKTYGLRRSRSFQPLAHSSRQGSIQRPDGAARTAPRDLLARGTPMGRAEAINGKSVMRLARGGGRLTALSAQRCGTCRCARGAADVTLFCATFE